MPQVEMDIQGHFRTLFFGIRKCLRFFMHCCPSNSDSIHHTTGKYCQTIAKYANRKFFLFSRLQEPVRHPESAVVETVNGSGAALHFLGND